jgi:hypothetical protein
VAISGIWIKITPGVLVIREGQPLGIAFSVLFVILEAASSGRRLLGERWLLVES